jgi:hypothetical protein
LHDWLEGSRDLADRGYSPQTVRAYAFDLLAFARWLAAERLALGEASADVVLRYLAYCRRALLPGSAAGCWPTWPGRNGALACGSASRRRLPRGLDRASPPRCWRASAPIRKGVPDH